MHMPPRFHYRFAAKVAAAAALIGLADLFFYGFWPGTTLGLFALAWIAVLALVRPDVRRHAPARLALLVAAGFGLILLDDPSLLGWSLFWVAIASATLLTRQGFTDAIGWSGRLLLHALAGLGTPFRDVRRFAVIRRLAERKGCGAAIAMLALPVIGGILFVLLFASANPVIGSFIGAIRLPYPATIAAHLALWSGVLLAIWPRLRPARVALLARPYRADHGPVVPPIPLATLTLSLVIFNAIFAVQNGLDLAFLWSGAPLPAGVTLADYAHRGAYALIVTALLAGTFVLVAARPGSDGERSTTVRWLLTAWIGQNVLLVASSVLRLLSYIDAFSLTILRIAALAWMALVAVGLVLIAWRMLAGRSTRWLINANALAAALVLTLCSIVDLGAVAATWNVRHARKAADLDLCYLGRLGPSALLPLIALEQRAQGPRLRDQAVFLRERIVADLEWSQADWRGWTWRNARRLATARRLLGPSPRTAQIVPDGRDCAGVPIPPRPVATPPTSPALTPAAKP